MKLADIAIICACASAFEQHTDIHDDTDFEDNMHFLYHVTKYNLAIETTEEFQFRKALYLETDKYIKEFNSEMGPNASFTLGHNKFSTWSANEHANLYRGNHHFMSTYEPANEVCGIQEKPEVEELGWGDINWVDEGAVTPVIDQKDCASDWAIATVGAIESAYYIFSGT